MTREQMIDKYGSVPFAIPKDKPYKWTIHRAHASVTWITTDGGDTWTKKGVVWADERNRRDLANLEQQEIQRTLKG